MTVQQAMNKIMQGKLKSHSPVLDLGLEIRQLVSLANSSMPIIDRELMVGDYLLHTVETCALWRHLLPMDTSTVESTVKAVEGYLAVGCD